MKKDCSNCDHLGRDCPKTLMLLHLDELIDWCKYVMAKHKITHDLLARLSNLPKGTIDRVLAKQAADCRYSTIHAMVCALFEFLGISSACLDDVPPEATAPKEDLTAQNTELRRALVDAEKDVQSLQGRVGDLVESRTMLKEQLVKKDRAIKTLTVLLGVSVLAVIIILLFV